jgi:hypothetical protein
MVLAGGLALLAGCAAEYGEYPAGYVSAYPYYGGYPYDYGGYYYPYGFVRREHFEHERHEARDHAAHEAHEHAQMRMPAQAPVHAAAPRSYSRAPAPVHAAPSGRHM